MNSIKNKFKKSLASILVGALVFTSLGTGKVGVKAAGTKTYISDVKLITGELTDSVKSKYKGYKFIENSLSQGGGGSKIYMAYKTTTDAKDAIRDIAFMQMKGNYSVSAYEKVLEDNMELASQSVEEFKSVVEEFRTNYNSSNEGKKKLADQAYELLNKYYEEDTGLGMGDFFLNKDGKVKDENYVTLAMQSTSTTLSVLQSIISKACDTDENATWIDRLVSYNGFEGLTKTKGFNPKDETSRKAALKQFETEYGDMVKYLTEEMEYSDQEESKCAWDKFSEGLKTYSDSLEGAVKEYDPKEESKAKSVEDAVKENEEIVEQENSIIYGSIYNTLVNIKYGEGTLADLFMKTSDEMTEEDFYPIIASLSKGQRVIALHTGFSVLLSNAGEQASADAITSDDKELEADEKLIEEKTGESLETIQEESAENQVDTIEETIEIVEDEMPDEVVDDLIIDDKISVYAGVDRSFFENGIAMTTKASEKDSDGGLQTKKTLPLVSYIAGAIGLATTVSGAIVFALANSHRLATLNSYLPELAEIASQRATCVSNLGVCTKLQSLAPATSQPSNALLEFTDRAGAINAEYGALDAKASQAAARSAATYKFVGSCLLVVGLALSAIAIVEAVISLIKKDNPKYTEIPMKMVDSSNGEKKNMEDFLYYNVVRNDNDEGQDLNNWTSGMWLAMYTSKTKDAGAPILADSFKVQADSNNTTGLQSAHLFGETGAYNMLSYSKNSKSQPKLFLYFERDNSGNVASTFGRNTLMISIGMFAIFCIVICYEISKNKKKKSESK